MRSYILTEHERGIIEFYKDKGLKLNGFRQMQYEAVKIDISRLEEDVELLKFLQSLKSS